MCGIFGGLGKGINVQTIRCLAILNESRGRDSMGFFDAHGKGWKSAETPTTWLQEPALAKVIDKMAASGAICGHTRGGTRGGKTTKNAHPFHYNVPGTEHFVVLSHNGVVDAPVAYTVDSEFLADLLAHHEPGNYQEALEDVQGWFALTWYDSRTNEIYLLNWECSLSFTTSNKGQTVYYSSDSRHLMTATACEKLRVLKDDGEVWKWNGRELTGCKRFKGQKRRKFTDKEWDNKYSTELTGSITRMKDGKYYAATRGRNYKLLTDQELWATRYPNLGKNAYGGHFIFPQGIKLELDPQSVDVDWAGEPILPAKPKGNDDDTILEASEQGVVITDTPGVSNASQALAEVTQETKHHALVKADVERRAQEAARQDFYDKQDREQPDSELIQRSEIIKGNPECPRCETVQQQQELRLQETLRMRQLGFGDDYIEESLWERGYHDPIRNSRRHSALFGV